MAATGFRLGVPRAYAIAWPAYGAGVLALDTHVGLVGERALGVLTWLVLLGALWPLPALARAQALGVVAFATIGEVAGSIVWGCITTVCTTCRCLSRPGTASCI